MMLLHGNLMCWRQFEDLIRCWKGNSACMPSASTALMEPVKRPTRLPGIQADKLAAYIEKELDGQLICFCRVAGLRIGCFSADRLFF